MKNTLTILLCFLSLSAFSQNTYRVKTEDDLSQIIALLEPGDTVSFDMGVYWGPVVINGVKGEQGNPIVFIGPADISQSAVIDGRRPSANPATSYNWMEIGNSSWLEFINIHFQNAWIDPLPINNSSYISFKNCYFQGGRRLINVRGASSHHILVENCFWDQGAAYSWNVRSWNDGKAWESMHHGNLSFLNGSLITMQGTSGSIVIRGNTIQNVFNGFRWRGDEGFDANIEIHDNLIRNVRDNDFEPEDYTRNLFIHHNRTHNIHKTLSIDHVRGGNIYYFGNIITNDDDSWSEEICTGYYKIYGTGDDNLSLPLHIFNNSYYGSGRLHGSIGSRSMKHVKHFNNAFYLTRRGWELNQWNETLVYDYDCSNKAFSARLTNNGQEANGVIADPLFTDPTAQDLTLQAGSPCVDAGTALSLPALNWRSVYQGSAPDIGAYDQDDPVIGPFYRTDTLAITNPIPERPRLTQLRTVGDSTFISFSYPLNDQSIAGNLTLYGASGKNQVLVNYKMQDNGYTIAFLSPFAVQKGIITGEMLGVNGLRATNWANASDFKQMKHEDVVVYMLQPQLQPRVPPPPNSNVYLEGNLERAIVPKGTELVISALADPGFEFDRWEGDINATDSIATITFNESAWVVGHFVKMEDEPDEKEPLGMKDGSEMLMIPNPSSGIVIIQGVEDGQSVKVIDAVGRIVRITMTDNQLDLSQFNEGLYILRLKQAGKLRVGKVYLRK